VHVNGFTISVRNERQHEEFTTLLKEKDDQIAQLLAEGNDNATTLN